MQPGHAERCGVACDGCGALRVLLDGDRGAARDRAQPLDRDRPAPGADVPQCLAGQRGKARQGDGADLPLGQLAVMLEGIVRQPGQARQRAGAGGHFAFEGDRVEVGALLLAPILRRAVPHRLARPTEMLEHADPARPPAGRNEQPGHTTRRRAVFRQHEAAPPGCQMQAQAVERAAVKAQCRALGQLPAEPGGGQAEGARLRQDRHLLAAKMAEKHGSDPVPQRVAACQHRDPGAAAHRDVGDRIGERLAPSDALGPAPRHQRQMAGAADQGLRRLDQGTRGRAQPGKPVIADADDAEPRLHPGRLPQSALTAAAASALPPRRPFSVT